MALSTVKRNKIIAEWKAGKFKSFYAVAKHYKISQPTVKEILADISQSNADIVHAGVVYESAKKLTKNLVEVKAIENLVKERTIAEEIKEEGLHATLLNIRSVKKKIQLEEVETMQDHKFAQDTIDRAMITAEVAPRHANTTINNTNATQNNYTPTEISKAIADGLPD